MGFFVRRFRFRFSVRTLLVATTVLGALLGLVGNEVNRLRLHRQAEGKVHELGGRCGSVTNGSYEPSWGPWWCPVIKDDAYADYQIVWFTSTSNEGLKDDDLAVLKHFPGLEELELYAPLITDQAIDHLRGIKSLRELSLYQTQVTGRGLKGLSGIPLEKLVLCGPDVTDETMEALAAFPGLRKMIISETSVTDVGLANLKYVPHLEKLIIADSPVGNAGMNELAKLTELYELDVEGLAITDEGIMPLAALPRLRYLNVAHTEVTEAGLFAFRNTKSLECFYIGPQPSPETDANLSSLLPGCSVYDTGSAGRCMQGW